MSKSDNKDIFSEFDRGDSDSIEFKEILKTLIRGRRIIYLTLISSFLFSASYTFYQRLRNPIYEGTFSILIKDPLDMEKGNAENTLAFSRIAMNAGDYDIPSLIKLLKSPVILEPFASKFKLDSSKLAKQIYIEKGKVGKMTSNRILSIRAQSNNRIEGLKLVENLSQFYLDLATIQKKQRSDAGLKFLNDQAPKLQEDVIKYEKDLTDFRENNFLIDPQIEGKTIKEKQLILENKITSLKFEESRLKNLEDGVKKGTLSVRRYNEAITSDSGPGGIIVSESEQELNQLLIVEKSLDEAKTKFTKDSTVIKNLENRLKVLKPQLKTSQLKAINAALEINSNKIKTAKKQLGNIKNELKTQPIIINQYDNIEQKLILAKQRLLSLNASIESFQLEMAQTSSPWKIIDFPTIGTRPVKPDISINFSISILLGIVIGSILAFLKDRFNYVFHNSNEIKEILQLPFLADIPFINKFEEMESNGDPKSEKSFNLDDFSFKISEEKELTKDEQYQRFFYMESLRNFYTSIRFLNTDSKIKTISLTSSIPGEGKSLVNILLAKTLSEMGKEILLIDADMRKPQIHKRLGVNNIRGLSNLLTDSQLEPDDVIQDIKDNKNLKVITSGLNPPDPLRLLSSNRINKIIEKIVESKKFDLIIFDIPPILGMSDALLLSEKIDGTILLISTNKVKRNLPLDAINKMRDAQLNILGYVINNVKEISANKFDLNNYAGYASAYAGYANIEENKVESVIQKNDKNIIYRLLNNSFAKYLKENYRILIKWLDS